jgi:hypothetical protein
MIALVGVWNFLPSAGYLSFLSFKYSFVVA